MKFSLIFKFDYGLRMFKMILSKFDLFNGQ